MNLTYEAIDDQGRKTRDTLEASDARDAVEKLRRRGFYVTRIDEATGKNSSARTPAESSDAGKLPLKTLVLFTRQMAMLLRAGSGIVPAIGAIKRQAKKPSEAALYQSLMDDLEEGVPLTETMRKHPGTFDSVYCAVIAAGEASAMLTEMLERLAGMVATRRALRNKVIGALTYPALLVVMSTNIILTLLLFVIPRFGDLFVQLGVEPPMSTRVFLAISAAVVTWWPLFVGGLVATVFGTIALLTSPRGRQWISNVQTRIPIFGRLRSLLIQAQVFRTVGTLVESNVGILDALELVRGTTRNDRFQRLFDTLEETVTAGGRIGAAFEESKIVEPYICQAVHTGEDSGNMGAALTYAADMLDETNTEVINTTMKLVEPIILMGLGVVVGAVAVSLFVPLLDLTSAMG